MKRSNLTAHILVQIVWEPGHTAAWIAKRVHSTPGTVSTILVRLVRKNRILRVNGCGPRGGYGYYPVKG